MSKQSVARIILKTFLKTIGIIVLFIGVGVLGYYLTMLYLKQTARVERSSQYTHVINVNTGNESSNLIYSFDEKTKKIEAMVLELFDETTKNLVYITIPANTQISISGETYTELIKVSQQLPQLAKMSEINNYFSGDVAYEYGIMILQEELKADIGYFTAMPSGQFNQYFEKKSKKNPAYQPSKTLLANAAKCKSKGDMNDLIESMWDKLICDITLSQKQNYSSALTQVKQEYIRAYEAYGKESGDVFLLSKRKNKKLINNIWESEAFTSPQPTKGGASGKSEAKGSSSGHTIQITNASNITGLAAAYKEKLQADNLNVIDVGNYFGGKLQKTKILTKKKSWGEDLLKYFKNATIEETSEKLTNGADIEIILGVQDNLS